MLSIFFKKSICVNTLGSVPEPLGRPQGVCIHANGTWEGNYVTSERSFVVESTGTVTYFVCLCTEYVLKCNSGLINK